MKTFILFSLSVFISVTAAQSAFSQEMLTLDEAIQTGFENNYGIQRFRNNLEIASNNRSLGNAGFLPTVLLSASQTERIEDSEFETGGDSQTTSGARSSVTNAALNAGWVVFDGLRMFTAYDRLGEIEQISDNQLRLEMEFLAEQIINAYYNIIRINEQLKVLENSVDVSLERIEIEETKLDLGSGSEYELLQAKSDLSADQAADLRENNNLTEAKITMNELLARSPSTEFSVTTEIPVNRSLSREELHRKLMAENSELAIARLLHRVAELEVQEIRGERFPEIALSSGYSYNRNEAGGGFFRFNETTGFSFGITARVNIFDGFNTNRRVQNAQINQKNARLQLEEDRLRLESDFLAVFRAYQNSIELVDLEQNNLENAEQTLDIALERFRLGSISSLELREAQRTFLAAENRLIDAKYDAKLAETELLQLSGDLKSTLVQ
ncbi:MAG: TolC family protein [Balneolaceae bacterium]